MGKRLYVGGLPFETTDAELQQVFTACGRVESAKVIIDKMSGRSKGFGFVEMATDVEAQAAILKFNGSSMGSRQITVNEARPMEDRKKSGGYGGGGGRRDGGGGFGGGRRDGGGGGGFGGGGGGRRDRGDSGGGFGGGFGGSRDEFGGKQRRDTSRGGNRKNSDGGSGNRW